MPKGGARSRSGPAPDPNALRRDRKTDATWTVLPASGRTNPPPAWPLVGQSEREAEMWDVYWAKPQAMVWERDSLVEYVALFVRQFIEAETVTSSAENRKTVRMMFADLYLTPDSMARARIRISGDDFTAKREGVEGSKRPSAKDRLTVVGSGTA